MDPTTTSSGDSRSSIREIAFRCTRAQDGRALREVVEATGVLDPNSTYAYVLLADRFADSCVLAEQGDEVVGFVTGFRDPRDPDVAFLWQIGLRPSAQGKGLGRRLLEAFLRAPGNAGARWLHTTVAEGNEASEALFRGFAARIGAEVEVDPGYPAPLLDPGHASERLFRIGPLPAP